MPRQEDADKGDPDSVSRHFCHCGKSFVRKEHLTRHQATHGGPAFVCDKCQRQFSRRDLLRRHVLLHDVRNSRTSASCDACRANKTKCSGGPSCSLCTRRGVSCTFRDRSRKAKRSLTRDASESMHTSSGQDEEDGLSSRAASAPSNPLTGAVHGADKVASPSLDFLHNLTIIPTKKTPARDFQPNGVGMEAVYEALVAGQSSLEQVLQKSPELRIWVTQTSAAYLEAFHDRWPILHAPTFDIEQDPLPLTATICIIGSWFRGPLISADKFYALRAHDFLLQRFLQDIADSEPLSSEKEWPIHFLRAVFFTLLFSLYRTEKTALSKAMLLRSVFVSYLKELGLFSAAALAAHQQRHCSGTFAPYVLQTRERYKKLAALVFQLDAYLSLAHGQSPMLHRQEVDVELNSTFASWNAFGIDVSIKRLSEEPPGRATATIGEMTKSPDSFKSSPLLVEDIQLGLCGLLQAVWVLAESFPPSDNGQFNAAFQKMLVIEKLDSWKTELDRTRALLQAGNVTIGVAKHLLLAYRGEDDSESASLKRINTLARDSMVLYYFMKLCACSGLRVFNLDVLNKQIQGPEAQAWKISKYGREAMVCALKILKTIEDPGPPVACLNPLIRHALTAGANMTRVWASEQTCQCPLKDGQSSTNLDPQRKVEYDGSIVVDGERVCACNLHIWMARFGKAVAEQNAIAE